MTGNNSEPEESGHNRRATEAIEERLRKIEVTLGVMSEKLDGLNSWMRSRDDECKHIERRLQELNVAVARQGVTITLVNVAMSAVIAVLVSYLLKFK